MSFGPGKYDDVCTFVRTTTDAQAAIVIVIEGEHGSGFSVQAEAHMLINLPALLEKVARGLREDQER